MSRGCHRANVRALVLSSAIAAVADCWEQAKASRLHGYVVVSLQRPSGIRRRETWRPTRQAGGLSGWATKEQS
jgi:hypothetical protein